MMAQRIVNGLELLYTRGRNKYRDCLEGAFTTNIDAGARNIVATGMDVHHGMHKAYEFFARFSEHFDGIILTGKFNFGGFLLAHLISSQKTQLYNEAIKED
jgi:hypothetical protein